MNPFVSKKRINPDVVIGVLLAVAAFVVYWRTMAPTVLDGDSGEFQYMLSVPGVLHSPGYPLYTLLGKLFTLLPLGDVAYRVNLLSVTFAALTAPLVFLTARQLMSGRLPAVIATCILAVAPSMWGGAVAAIDSYSFHLFLGVLTVLFAVRWHRLGKLRDFYALAFVYGLALTNHPIIRFIAPALGLLLWLDRTRLDRGMVARGMILTVVPLLLYAYVPIRAGQLIAQQNPANLEIYTRPDAMVKGIVSAYYNHSLQGVFDFISAFDNRSKLVVRSPIDQMNRVALSANLLWAQFGLAGIGLALVGGLQSFRRDRKVFMFLAGIAGCIGLVAFILKGTSTVYYFSMTYFVLALWIALGMEWLMRWAESIGRAAASAWVALAASPRVIALVLCLLPISALAANWQSMDQSSNYKARDNALAVLRDNLAPNAIVVAPWEVSEPMRYFQFVENVRPDLLVVNVPPIWKQFDVMLANAHAANRPFYFVQFSPEFNSDLGPRSVQAVPLPLNPAPQPRYTLSNARLTPQVQVTGYELDPDPPEPGKPIRLWVYYRAAERMYPMYSAMLTVGDITGKLWSEYSGFPVSRYFETYRWYELGEYYRDGWSINLPADAPMGLYTLSLSWYVYDLETLKPDYASEIQVDLGQVRVGNFTASGNTGVKPVQVGSAISFMGWESKPNSTPGNSLNVRRGSSVDLSLLWRADGPISQSYTVFVHLIDGAGNVMAGADSPPLQGLFPTDRWVVGETIRDRHTLLVPADLAPGNYAIEIGMYLPQSNQRLPISGSDKLMLTQLQVTN